MNKRYFKYNYYNSIVMMILCSALIIESFITNSWFFNLINNSTVKYIIFFFIITIFNLLIIDSFYKKKFSIENDKIIVHIRKKSFVYDLLSIKKVNYKKNLLSIILKTTNVDFQINKKYYSFTLKNKDLKLFEELINKYNNVEIFYIEYYKILIKRLLIWTQIITFIVAIFYEKYILIIITFLSIIIEGIFTKKYIDSVK